MYLRKSALQVWNALFWSLENSATRALFPLTLVVVATCVWWPPEHAFLCKMCYLLPETVDRSPASRLSNFRNSVPQSLVLLGRHPLLYTRTRKVFLTKVFHGHERFIRCDFFRWFIDPTDAVVSGILPKDPERIPWCFPKIDLTRAHH